MALERKWRPPATPGASWRPRGRVGADRRSRRQRTAAMGHPRVGWPVTDETGLVDSVAIDTD